MPDIRDKHSDKIMIDPNSGCWLWVGANDAGFGYGKIYFTRGKSRKYRYAHRASWEISYGPISDETKVLHKCDVPSCVNPAHLFTGTQGDNVRDAIRKGRHRNNNPNYFGENHGMATITLATAKQIKSMLKDNFTASKISEALNVSIHVVYHIKAGKVWVSA